MTTLHGKEVKVGDKVWDITKGWTKVIGIYEDSIYQIRTAQASYNNAGSILMEDRLPSLFWQEFKIPAHAFEKPKVKVKRYIVLYEVVGTYHITSNNIRGIYYSSKEEFDKVNVNQKYKFISLIMESEREFEE